MGDPLLGDYTFQVCTGCVQRRHPVSTHYPDKFQFQNAPWSSKATHRGNIDQRPRKRSGNIFISEARRKSRRQSTTSIDGVCTPTFLLRQLLGRSSSFLGLTKYVSSHPIPKRHREAGGGRLDYAEKDFEVPGVEIRKIGFGVDHSIRRG